MASNADDYESELWEISENQNFKDFEPPPPPTITEWNAKMSRNNNGSIFDTVIEENIVISGRGRGIPHFIIKPGDDYPNNDYDYKEDEEIKRRIRETSGIGYSNSLIEEIHRTEVAKLEKESSTVDSIYDKNPYMLRLGHLSIKSDSSRSSSPISGSISSLELSPRNTRNEDLSINSGPSNGPIKSIKSYSALLDKKRLEIQDQKNYLEDCDMSRPPPLSQMLKNAKLKHNRQIEAKSKNCDIGTEYEKPKRHSWGTRKKPFDDSPRLTSPKNLENRAIKDFWGINPQKNVQTINIESEKEFPPL